MKPIDPSKLQMILDEDFTWRKREISDLIGIAQTGSLTEKKTARRASIPIIYAHWEGFVKNAFVQYFEFVSIKGKSFSDLTPNFLYLASKSDIGTIPKAPHKLALQKFEDIFHRTSKKNRDPMRKYVVTRDNLRWDVLTDLFLISGIKMPDVDYQKVVDIDLCDRRNSIAHGESADPSLDQIIKIRSDIFYLMDTIKNCIVTGAANESFLRLRATAPSVPSAETNA